MAKSFKDFNIKSVNVFVGKKIDVDEILGKSIMVHKYKIAQSKFPKDNRHNQLLHLQISVKDEMRVAFIPSIVLIESILQVPETEFPFETTIIANYRSLQFS